MRDIYERDELTLDQSVLAIQKFLRFVIWFYENDWVQFATSVSCYEHTFAFCFTNIRVSCVFDPRREFECYYIEDDEARVEFDAIKSFKKLSKILSTPEMQLLCKGEIS